jgi:hypothetical protein
MVGLVKNSDPRSEHIDLRGFANKPYSDLSTKIKVFNFHHPTDTEQDAFSQVKVNFALEHAMKAQREVDV